MIIRDHVGETVVSCQGTGNITEIRSHAPSLVVSVSNIICRSTGAGTAKGWFFSRILAITTAFLCAAIISFTVGNNLLLLILRKTMILGLTPLKGFYDMTCVT